MTSKFEILQIVAMVTLIVALTIAVLWGKIILMSMGVFAADHYGIIGVLISH